MLDDMEAPRLLPRPLSDTEITALQAWGTAVQSQSSAKELAELEKAAIPNKAAMRRVETLEDFVARANNFAERFRNPRSRSPDQTVSENVLVYQRQRSTQRFEVLHPEKVETLTGRLNEYPEQDIDQFDPETQELLLKAYNLMVGLVSADDLGVKDNAGNVSQDYLFQ